MGIKSNSVKYSERKKKCIAEEKDSVLLRWSNLKQDTGKNMNIKDVFLWGLKTGEHIIGQWKKIDSCHKVLTNMIEVEHLVEVWLYLFLFFFLEGRTLEWQNRIFSLGGF